MNDSLPLVITLVGPTASGKTSLSIALAKKLHGEIISADSRQIYREMNIGTAKVPQKEMDGIPHHLLDIRNPDEEYSVAEFQSDANNIIQDILKRGKQPLVVGGTGMYVASLVEHWHIPAIPPNKQFRTRHAQEPTEELFNMLQKRDPEIASIIDSSNRHRVIRALEKTLFGKQFLGDKQPSPYNWLQFGIRTERDVLYKRINARVDDMMANGFLDEVLRLSEKYSWDAPGLNAIGYRQLGLYLQDQSSLSEAIERIKRDTRRYAKRQMTWFRRDRTIHWISGIDEIVSLLSQNSVSIPPSHRS